MTHSDEQPGHPRKASRQWLIERITALLLIGLTPWLTLSLAALPGQSYAAFVEWLLPPEHYLALLAFVVISAEHAWLGLESIMMDYVQGRLIRRVGLAAIRLTLLGVIAVSGTATILLLQTH